MQIISKIKHGKGIKNADKIYEGILEQLQWGQKTTFNENSECCIFQGKMNNKKLNGVGLKKSSFEYEVKAHFMDDKIQGEGLLTTKKGDQYKGEFYENKKYGHGEFQTTKGDRYEGEFYKDKKQGRGTYYFPNGDIYNGQFQDDQIHGKGELKIYSTGYVYNGLFKYNKKKKILKSNIHMDRSIYIL